MAKRSAHQVVSANKLLEGDVVYFSERGEWTRDVNCARVAHGKESATELLQAADLTPHLVVGPYLVDVELDADQVRPSHMREVMRETGPTVGPLA